MGWRRWVGGVEPPEVADRQLHLAFVAAVGLLGIIEQSEQGHELPGRGQRCRAQAATNHAGIIRDHMVR